MLIAVRCTGCGANFYVEDRFAGKVGVCPSRECGQRYVVPDSPAKYNVATSRAKESRAKRAMPSKTGASVKPPALRTTKLAESSSKSVTKTSKTVRRKTLERTGGASVEGTARRFAAKPQAGGRGRRSGEATASTQRTKPHRTEPRRVNGRSRRRKPVWWRQRPIQTAGGVSALLIAVVVAMSGDGDNNSQGQPIPTAPVVHKDAKANPATDELFKTRVKPFLKKYCFDCHADGAEEAGLALDSFTTPASVLEKRKRWEKVLHMLTAEAMPPGDHDPQPSKEERAGVVQWVEDKLFWIDCDLPPDPGRVTIRRLNRAEYNNTIRDLVGVDFKPAKDFPSDEVGEGFDNIGDVLSLPPLLLEKYLDAAEQVTEKAIVGTPTKLASRRVTADRLKKSGGAGGESEGFVGINSNGSVYDTFDFSRDGEYLLRAEARADQAGDEPAKMQFRIDGKELKTFDIEGRRRPKVYEAKFRVSRGKHKLEAAFINDYYNPKARDRRQRDRNLGVAYLEIRATKFDPASLPKTHKAIVSVTPKKGESPGPAAREALLKFLPRAFRRPVDDHEADKYVGLVEAAVKRGDTYEESMQLAVQAILVSPHFLFRVESHPKPNDPEVTKTLSDYELASRLSYFLWSSMPDEELFGLAATGELHKPGVVKQQVRRMLGDAKSQALVNNFAEQWLNLRNLDELSPDPKRFPDYDKQLREDMKRESLEFFAAVMKEDRSILDFLDGNFTYVNERLAKHYGIGGVKGDEFRRVSLTGLPRAGVLTQGSILTLTSNPTRTSPVKRGKWVLENILGTPPPPPPPDVPELEIAAKKAPKGASLRQQLELHREDARCATCHRTMDAIGFGFENFDAVGQWRDRDDGAKIDAAGELPGSGRFTGPIELVKALKQRDDDFRRTFVRSLLTYGLGRGLEYYDRCTVDEICQTMKSDGDRFTLLVEQIAMSGPFLKRRGDAGKNTE